MKKKSDASKSHDINPISKSAYKAFLLLLVWKENVTVLTSATFLTTFVMN